MNKIRLQDIEWKDRFDHKKALLFNEEDLSSKGSKIQLIKILPQEEIKSHFHKIRIEVFCILKGTGTIQLNDEEFACNIGDFLLCKPTTVHAFRNKSDEDFVVAVIRTNDTGDSDMLWVEAR